MDVPGDRGEVVGDRETKAAERRGRPGGGDPAPEADRASGHLLSQVPADIRDVSFGTALRGYDRREVDLYVKRVNGVIAELEISRSPQSAIKHALDRVGEQTSGVLQRAREAAEELTEAALTEADHVTRRAKVEAEELVEKAQMRAHELRGQSKVEADEIVARAAAAAAERLKGAQEEARAVQAESASRLRSLHADIQRATDARRRLLDGLRQSAADLEAFAGGMLAREDDDRGSGADDDAPTEVLPTEVLPTEALPTEAAPTEAITPAERVSPPRPGAQGKGARPVATNRKRGEEERRSARAAGPKTKG